MNFILILETPAGESDEAMRERIDYANLPEHLWDIIPEDDSFLRNIMKFGGYVNRYMIIKLKDPSEIKKMFDYVTERVELVDDKKAMFGIFERNLSLLSIPPGTQGNLERFIDKVDKLLPKPSKPNKLRKKSNGASKSKDPTTSNISKETVKPTTTLETLKKTLRKVV